MTHGSLFSGIGGIDLAAEWMGWENKFHCESNPFGQRVLKYYWPDAELFTDITKSNFTKYANTIDVVSGGFPCQPYSAAGKRLGKEDNRHLWPEMLRAIREIQPRWVVGENVRGLINWNGGLVFDEVQADLEAEGYEVTPFLLPACGVNAPHERYRVWFVAHSAVKRLERTGEPRVYRPEAFAEPSGPGSARSFADSAGLRQPSQEYREKESRRVAKASGPNDWKNWPTERPVRDGDDGIPGRLVGTTFPFWRNEGIKAGGNAVVVNLPYKIFQAIQSYENTLIKTSYGIHH